MKCMNLIASFVQRGMFCGKLRITKFSDPQLKFIYQNENQSDSEVEEELILNSGE